MTQVTSPPACIHAGIYASSRASSRSLVHSSHVQQRCVAAVANNCSGCRLVGLVFTTERASVRHVTGVAGKAVYVAAWRGGLGAIASRLPRVVSVNQVLPLSGIVPCAAGHPFLRPKMVLCNYACVCVWCRFLLMCVCLVTVHITLGCLLEGARGWAIVWAWCLVWCSLHATQLQATCMYCAPLSSVHLRSGGSAILDTLGAADDTVLLTHM